jgi:hypothetical protein
MIHTNYLHVSLDRDARQDQVNSEKVQKLGSSADL